MCSSDLKILRPIENYPSNLARFIDNLFEIHGPSLIFQASLTNLSCSGKFPDALPFFVD
jgi:hypothetical protein